MRILILAVGSRGDTQPCVALGAGLLARGHQVRVVASSPYTDLVTDAGLDYAPISIDPAEIVRSGTGRDLVGGGSTLQTLLRFRRVAGPLVRQVMADCDAAADGADMVLAPHLGWMGNHIAQRHGIPHVIVRFSPGDPTAEFASPLLYGRRFGRIGNRISHHALDQAIWQLLRSTVNRARASELGLPKLPITGPQRAARRNNVPVLCAFSKHVVPRPADWPANIHLTGYWIHDQQPDWTPPATLTDFLAAGTPPVFVGFGSLALDHTDKVNHIVRQALRTAGTRGILQGQSEHTSDADILEISDVPHTWLFPRMRAVVHHGGAGTTAAGLRAGVPNVIVCPSFSDQPFWGQRVAALDAGPPPIRFKDLTPQRLADAIRQAQSTNGAQHLAHRLRAESGVDRACDLIDQWT